MIVLERMIVLKRMIVLERQPFVLSQRSSFDASNFICPFVSGSLKGSK